MRRNGELEVLALLGALWLLLLCLWRVATQATATPSCTIFTAARDGQVLFGNNEDHHYRDLVVGLQPASAASDGSVHLGVRKPDGAIVYCGAVNQFGLAWDVNTTPRSRLNPHPERPRSHAEDNFLTSLTKRATTVEGAIRLAKTYDFGSAMASHIHIADATGDAVIISAGPDGELAFTRIDGREGHLVSTNFNRADYRASEVGWRYETAIDMLVELGADRPLTPDYATSILDAVHLNMLTTYTLYSNAVDLPNKVIHLNYMSQYGETAVLDIADELAKGARVASMRDLFSADTTTSGDLAYGRFERRFTAAKTVVVALAAALLCGAGYLVARVAQGRARRRPL